MKKVLFLTLMAAMIFSFAACGSDGGNSNDVKKMDIPEWFLLPPTMEDTIIGLGMAKMKDVANSRDAAISRARRDIAFQVNARVEAMITDYYQEAGVDDNAQAIKFYEAISKQITAIDLTNATTKKVEIGDDGTVYAMVEFPRNQMLDEVGEVFERNEDAAFAEFKKEQALEKLNMEMESNPEYTKNEENEGL